MMWSRKPNRLKARVLKLENELAAERARNLVLQAEIDALAGVIARDRARVQAETAEFHARRASAEGSPPHERNRTSAG